jgi:hypothetical protein
MLRQEVQTADSRVLRPAAGQKHWFTPAMPRDNPATTVATCAGCATSWRGIGRAHCRACHATFDDEALFDAHRLTRKLRTAVGNVWCRPLAG